MPEMRPLYCVYCGQTLVSADMEKCSGCGRVGGIADANDHLAIAALQARLHSQSQPGSSPPASGSEPVPAPSAASDFRAFRVVLAAVVCIGLGALWLFNQDSWSDRSRLDLNDALPRGGGLFIMALLALVILPLLWRKRSAAPWVRRVVMGGLIGIAIFALAVFLR